MRTIITHATAALLGAALFVGGIAYAATLAEPTLKKLDAPSTTTAATKACLFPSGGWTTIDSDNSGGNASGSIGGFARVAVYCADDAHISFTGTTADASDGVLPAGAWLEFMTGGDSSTFSVLNVNSATADCFYIECG